MTVSIPAGELNRRVEIQQLSGTPDTGGHIDETDDGNWRPVTKRWCKLIPSGSREFFRGMQVAADITHQVTMRYDERTRNLTTKERLKLGVRKFNIAAPPTDVEEAHVLVTFPAIEVK